MEIIIDIRTALEQLGKEWQFGGSVTDGTQQAWDAVKWEDERPKPTWAELLEALTPNIMTVRVNKRAEINLGFESAMTASLTMPSATNPPSAFSIYHAIEAWKADDPEGLAYIQTTHETQRDALLAAVDAATSVAEIQAITVTYAV